MPVAEQQRLDVPYLHDFWSAALHGTPLVAHDITATLLSGLGLNSLEAGQFLYGNRPSFEQFEQWIVERNGGALHAAELDRLRRALSGEQVSSAAGDLTAVEGLTADDLAHWDEHGYVILRNAVPPAQAEAAAAEIFRHLNASPDDPDSWYANEQGHSIWVRTVRHPAFVANRRTPRVLKAFAQLWGREDLWPVVDQGGLNPPERPDWRFPGPHLHWDYSLARPHTLDIQGILYLTDTPAHQGAFTCVPDFHRTLGQWLDALPAGAKPREAILNHPGAKPIAANAGDLVLWHAMLPHGSSPNRGTQPRVVQYLSMRPTRWDRTEEWL